MGQHEEGMGDRILLTGATGYVGGRLLGALEALGESVRCLTRRPENLVARVGSGTEVVKGDVLDKASLAPALEGCKVAYYLVHSMGSQGDFVDQDRQASEDFAAAAKAAGVERIIYLGGLGDEAELSTHLASRQEVGQVLRTSGVSTIELRASIVIGSGSLSFEMIRALVDRLPVMITPRWVGSRAQPIAIEDVVEYLLEARRIPLAGSRVFEIGGADQASYADIMLEYARQRGLRRRLIPVPVLTPRLSGLWLGLVTPLYARVGRKLVESLKHDTIVKDASALRAFSVRPRGSPRPSRAASRTRTETSLKRVGRTLCRLMARLEVGAAFSSARDWWTLAPERCRSIANRLLRPSGGLGEGRVGITETPFGAFAVS